MSSGSGKKGKRMITEKQRAAVDMVAKQIRSLDGGKYIEVFCSLTGMVRIQDNRSEDTKKHYRMFCVCEGDTLAVIRNKMMNLFDEIRKAIGE